MNGEFRRTAGMKAVVATVMTIVAASWLFVAATPATATSTCADIGTTWTSRTSAGDGAWTSVVWGGPTGQEKFVAVGEGGTVGKRVMTSPDGITWTIGNSANNTPWQSITYGGGLFVAVSTGDGSNNVMTSPDGITWTTRAAATAGDWMSVTYGGGLFVAVSSSGSGNRVMTSPDGTTWTTRTSANNNNWNSVTYGGGLFVAVSSSGSGNRVMTSPDGITWTTRTSAADNNWMSVTYGGGRFVAVSSSGTGNRVMTSPDGTTWTTRTSANNNNWRSVTWGGPTGQEKFVAVGELGSTDRVMTSPDGTTWTTRTSANNNNWRSVTWGGPTGQEKFVAVSSTGISNQVMTAICPASVPAAPTVSSVTAADGSLTVAFTAGTDGGSPITNYKYSIDGTNYTALNPAATTSPFTISGLTNGTTYSVTIKAVNAIGDSVASNAITGTPVAVPAAPTVSSVTAADGSLSVAFTAGADGGSPITNYKYSIDGTNYTALNPAATTSPFTISGLTNGTTYSVTIKAVNAIGDSVASNAITGTPVAPAATPTEPNNTPTSVAATLTVAPTPGLAETVSLPETGGNSSTAATIGLFLAIAGLILVSRRKIIR